MPAYKLTEHKNLENLAGIFRIFYSDFSYGIIDSKMEKNCEKYQK